MTDFDDLEREHDPDAEPELPALCAKCEMKYGRYQPDCPDCRELNRARRR